MHILDETLYGFLGHVTDDLLNNTLYDAGDGTGDDIRDNMMDRYTIQRLF